MSSNVTGVVEFDRVVKSFDGPDGRHAVIAAFDAVFGPEESVGIIGPNGAGKSTLLRLAAGVSAPTSGEIRRYGRCCSVIELGAGVHPDLTGDENARLLAALMGIRSNDLNERLPEIIDFSGLADRWRDPVRTYSTGMVARLAFSVAVHSDPDLLLVDEVLSVGDLTFQHSARQRIGELRARGTTVVLVSHDLELIEELCDRTLLLVDGVLEEDDATDVVLRRYRGLPDESHAGVDLRCRLQSKVIRSGNPVRFTVASVPPETVRLRVELIVHEHPTFLSLGENISVTFASSLVVADPQRDDVSWQFPTAGLPGGRFVLRLTAEDAAGHPCAVSSTPITVVADEGPFAIRLIGEPTFQAVKG